MMYIHISKNLQFHKTKIIFDIMLNKVYVWKMFAPRNILNNQIPNKAQTFGNGNSKYFFFSRVKYPL